MANTIIQCTGFICFVSFLCFLNLKLDQGGHNITKWLISITIWVFQITLTTPNQKRENYQKAFPDKRVDVELGQKFHNFNILYKNFPLDDSRDS